MRRLPLRRSLVGLRRAALTVGGAAAAETKSGGDSKHEELKRRLAFFKASAAVTPYLAVRSGEEMYFVATDDVGVGRTLFVHGKRTDQETLEQAVGRLAALGVEPRVAPVLVEVGANIGTTTIPALLRHGFRAAVAVEASPENFRLLRINLTANGVDDRVRAIAAAAHDSEGELAFEVSSAQRGSHRVMQPHMWQKKHKKREIITVPAITLDGLVADGVVDPASVGLLWVDSPRHEGKVLLGASALIEAGVPIVVAIRVAGRRGDPHRPWAVPPEAKERLLQRLTSSYTHVVVLDWTAPLDEASPISDLRSTLDSFRGTTDVLLVRRRA